MGNPKFYVCTLLRSSEFTVEAHLWVLFCLTADYNPTINVHTMTNWVDFVDVMHVKIMNGMLPANYCLDLLVRIS